MKIPFYKPSLGKEEYREVKKVLDSGWLTLGEKTIEFENLFKKYVNADDAVAVSSCTAGLHICLRLINLKPGDEVIVPANTFTATAEVVKYFNAVPVIVDIDYKTGNILPEAIERNITSRTKAIIPVHFAGLPADIDKIKKLAGSKIKIIEDSAHALPAFYKNKKIGEISEFTCFSFYATKPVTTGDGGMITFKGRNYKKNSKLARLLRLHGISSYAWKRYKEKNLWFYKVLTWGYKYNITDIQSAIGIVQLKKADKLWEKRRKIAYYYNLLLKSASDLVDIPCEPENMVSSWHLCVIKLNLKKLKISREEVIYRLSKKDIMCGVHFIPLYRHPFYKKEYKYKIKDFKNSEKFYKSAISLPLYPDMKKKEVEYVVENLLEILKKNIR